MVLTKFFYGVYFIMTSTTSGISPDVAQAAASIGANITWPTAIAIVASIVTIVTGACTYLLGIKRIKYNKAQHQVEQAQQQAEQSQSDIRSEILEQKIENLEEKFNEHEKRDTRDFETVNHKIDKLTDILMKILSDDRL